MAGTSFCGHDRRAPHQPDRTTTSVNQTDSNPTPCSDVARRHHFATGWLSGALGADNCYAYATQENPLTFNGNVHARSLHGDTAVKIVAFQRG